LRYALYLGCTVQADQFCYEASVRRVMPRLGVDLVDIEGASCCGFPAFSSVSNVGRLYLSARNLALVDSLGLDMLPLCNGCHLSFVETKHAIENDPNLRGFLEGKLREEGLEYTGEGQIIHIIELLHDVIGPQKISEAVAKPLEGIKVVSHPGCHAIRPSSLGRPDDPENPVKLDHLISALGAETMDYPEKTDCCGSMLATASGKTTLTIAGEKLKAIRDYGVDGLVTTCPFCFKMFDGRQRAIQTAMGDRTLEMPVFYYTQLLGLAMGLDPGDLGLEFNLSPVDSIVERITGGGNG
jgi:heterodisulfide reductase subunit B